MALREKLADRLHINDIRLLAADDTLSAREALYGLIGDAEERVGYNALWAMTHFASSDNGWLATKRDGLIDRLLACNHVGKKRLLLTLLDRLPVQPEDIRTDYLDFCLAAINSSEPYAIRAFCMKQAYAQCRLYPELLQEFSAILEMTDQSELSPGLKSAKRNILKQMARAK